MLAAHSAFFDQLVDLVPAKFYHESEIETTNPRFLKKAERAAARAAAKQGYKQSKKAKLDPDQAKTSLDVQREQHEAKQQQAAADGSAAPGGNGSGPGLQFNIGSGAPASREDLKAKLHAKLEALRGERKMEERKKTMEGAQEWLKNKKGAGTSKLKQGGKQQKSSGSAGPSSAGAKAEPNLQFGNLKVQEGRDNQHGKKDKRPAPSKEELLQKAISKKEKAAAMAGTEEGEAALQKDAYRTAAARARGEAVLDDPKLLRRTIKKEGKAKAKSREAWSERKQKETDKKDAVQKRRKDNLKKRADGKIQRKKDKRDKKLLRPGFEGRKAGSIQKKGGGGKK